MRRVLTILFAIIMVLTLGACGKNESSNRNQDSIRIEDIEWKVEESMVDGQRYAALHYTNNSKYTISYFEMTFKQKSYITEEQLDRYYRDIKDYLTNSNYKREELDNRMNELKKKEIFMRAKFFEIVESGESVTTAKLRYHDLYYLPNVNHYDLVQPDTATITYVDKDKIHTIQYDFSSKKYSEENTPPAFERYEWAKNDIGKKLPKPDVKLVSVRVDEPNNFEFTAYGTSKEKFESYIEGCKNAGYAVDVSRDEYAYSAKNQEGYKISLKHIEGQYMMNGEIKKL